MPELARRTVLVTGADSGSGNPLPSKLPKAGAAVMALDVQAVEATVTDPAFPNAGSSCPLPHPQVRKAWIVSIGEKLFHAFQRARPPP